MWESLGPIMTPSLHPSGHMKHLSPNEELYEKLLDYEVFVIYKESKLTTLIIAPIDQKKQPSTFKK